MSYLLQGKYPLREGTCHDGSVLLSWAIWTVPDASNDETYVPPPTFA